MGAEHGATRQRQTWAEQREAGGRELGQHRRSPTSLVVGGGQGGIALGARLRQLGVPALIIDKHARPGDQWRNRYKSLCLHDPVWYDHLPYLKFPDNWPVFAPKDKIGDWLEMYTAVMELNYWSRTTATQRHATTRRPGSGRVEVERDGQAADAAPDAAGLRPRRLRQAERARAPRSGRLRAATSTTPRQHPGPDAYVGKKVVVIGSQQLAPSTSAARCGRPAPT